MKKLLQNASGQLKILPFHSNCTKMFCTIFFFSSLSYQKQRKSKFCLGEMRFCLGELGFGGGRIRIWWGAIQKILVGRWNSSPSSPPHTHTLRRTLILQGVCQVRENSGNFFSWKSRGKVRKIR